MNLSQLAVRLRAAGCVYAEEEAAILLAAARGDRLEALVGRREDGEPLEHLVGRVRFGGIDLAVGPGAFIPRQRSLLLARAAVAAARAKTAPVVLEAYCGVAPIAASIARRVPGAQLHAADLDATARRYARRNLPAGSGVHRADGLRGLPASLRGLVDVLVAVPPYVPESQARLLARDQLRHEPAAALFGGDDGLDHVRALTAAAGPWLAPDALVLVELNRGQLPAAIGYAKSAGYRARGRRGGDGQTVLLDLRP